MEANKYDILDLVLATVIYLYDPTGNGTGKIPDVRLNGDNICIGDKSVSIADIEDTKHSAKGFLKLIKGAM